MQLILTAHGSADPRSAANARAVARTVAALRRDVDVKVAFCEQNSPNLRDVLADVPADARILKEEVFGPVAPVTGFDTEDEAIAAANDTEYGLAAYIYTQSLDRALRVSEALESGMVGVNRGVISDPAAPFGGVKSSGFGREGGTEGIEEYLDTKYIALTS